ncbi:MAG: transposase [Bacteroidales bacterium]|nr:transposase [Bacteroidales bacterium]
MPSKDQEILRLQAELARLQAENLKLEEEKEKMQGIIDGLQNMMAWFRKKLFGSMSEKHLPLDPSVPQPSLFDELLSEEEQSALDAEVRKMEEQNAKLIEVKPHKREVRKPILKGDLPVEETHIHSEGINLDCQAIQKRRQEESYKIIQEFEKWMNSVAGLFTPKSRMEKHWCIHIPFCHA